MCTKLFLAFAKLFCCVSDYWKRRCYCFPVNPPIFINSVTLVRGSVRFGHLLSPVGEVAPCAGSFAVLIDNYRKASTRCKHPVLQFNVLAHRPVTRGRKEANPSGNFFAPPLDKYVAHNLKVLGIVLKILTTVRKLSSPPGVPSCLGACLHDRNRESLVRQCSITNFTFNWTKTSCRFHRWLAFTYILDVCRCRLCTSSLLWPSSYHLSYTIPSSHFQETGCLIAVIHFLAVLALCLCRLQVKETARQQHCLVPRSKNCRTCPMKTLLISLCETVV